MRLVQQRFARDCGIAVAAMVSGRPYDKVREDARRAGLLHTSGTSIARLVAILERSTRRRWRESWPEEFLPIAECRSVARSPRPVALLIRCPCGCDAYHWIAAHHSWILDPGAERCWRLSRYPQRAWVLRRVVEPSR